MGKKEKTEEIKVGVRDLAYQTALLERLERELERKTKLRPLIKGLIRWLRDINDELMMEPWADPRQVGRLSPCHRAARLSTGFLAYNQAAALGWPEDKLADLSALNELLDSIWDADCNKRDVILVATQLEGLK